MNNSLIITRQIDENRRFSRRLDNLDAKLRELRIAMQAIYAMMDKLIAAIEHKSIMKEVAEIVAKQYNGTPKNMADK